MHQLVYGIKTLKNSYNSFERDVYIHGDCFIEQEKQSGENIGYM